MTNTPTRTTVDLSAYPDLVVIYLGMRVEEPRGYETLQKLHPQIEATVESQPDGLLLHETLTYSQEPLHVGMRQYWRDFESLEAWSLTLPTSSGGQISSATAAAPRSGTRLTSAAAASSRCSSIATSLSVSCASRHPHLPRGPCSRPVNGATPIGRARQPRRSPVAADGVREPNPSSLSRA